MTSAARAASTAGEELPAAKLALAWLTGGFGLSVNAMMVFLLPLRAAELGASLSAVGLIVGAGSFVPLVLSMPVGALSDRVGPRRVFRLGTAGTAVGAVGMAAAGSWWMLLVLQLVVGPSRASGWVSSQSYITGMGKPADRARNASRFSFVTNISRMLGPLLVGLSASLVGFRASFLVVAAYAGLYTVVAAVLPDAGRAERRAGTTRVPRAVVDLLTRRGIQVALVLTFARLWLSVVFASFVPLYLVDRDISAAVAGTVLACAAAVGTLMTLATPWLVRSVTKELVTAAALGCGAAGLALIPVAGGPPWIYAAAALVGVGEGVSLPLLIAIVGGQASPEQRGLAIGLRVSANQAANSVAPVVVGAVVGVTGMAVGFPVAATAGVGFLALASAMHVVDSRSAPGPARLPAPGAR